jgi:hypothetical protein
MVPIGIVTRNRHKYLDVTLRSLSCSEYPEKPSLTIFDDGSNNADTVSYLYTAKTVSLGQAWPTDKYWQRLGLGGIRSRTSGPGLVDLVDVVKLGKRPQGVVNATCDAIRRLCAAHPDEAAKDGVIILQDDVVFNVDWLTRLAEERQRLEAAGENPGLLAGVMLNRNITATKSAILIGRRAATAQCYWLLPAGLARANQWLNTVHDTKKGFDDKLTLIIQRKCNVFLINPPVCQHIGLVSLVRGRRWRWCSVQGRVGYTAKGPYPLAAQVMKFK